jgi:protein SCO1/2
MFSLWHIAKAPFLALTLAVAAAAWAFALPAAAQAGKTMPGTHVDPMSFKGPNPADQFKDIYIEQKLNNQVNLDLKFRDETGVERSLREYIGDKPVVLGMVYYECPNVCSVILNAMLVSFDAGALDLELGKDFVAGRGLLLLQRHRAQPRHARHMGYSTHHHGRGI